MPDPRQSFYTGRGWVDHLRSADDRTYETLTITSGGRDVDVAVWVADERTPPSSGYSAATLTGDPDADDRDHLFVGPHRGYDNTLPAVDGVDRFATVEAVIGAAREAATRSGLRGVVVPYLDTADAAALLEADPDASVPVLLDPTMTLELAGTSFADHLVALGSRSGSKIRREMRKTEASGVVASVEALADTADELGPLVSAVQRHHGLDEPPEQCVAALRGQAEHCGSDALVFALRSGADGRLVTGALYYETPDTLYSRMVGIDYDRARHGEYFAANIYAPIQYAYAHGQRRIEMGRKSETAKGQRGAVPRPQWSVLLPCEPHGRRVDIRRLNSARLQRICDTVPAMTRVAVPTEWFATPTASGETR